MPNHCCNSLIMSEDILPIILQNYVRRDERGQEIFDFEHIKPIGDATDLEWERQERWGTKWNGYGLSIGDSILEFYTAWTPPIPIIAKLAELHRDFVFRLEYFEVGLAFRGIATARWNGDEVLLEDDNWDMTEKDFEELGLD
jgi:hypothetical protein